ncbi:helix-turn-helix transcriptional regulator [Brachybacterium sp. ACRRE]|uniref:helix-turn-helix transcriptional regulator n=1 Tax=Brachybacterium sp. ACRRE TaxID=2918184 RepID=UPI001EF165CA|nr:helix-turn-helix transcriptional regulator [Brachybacterium sp. ACRRE]MCG7308548.1 helix-turn-helix transcriptional regulator [Brachybacterium sp. ACRRE]
MTHRALEDRLSEIVRLRAVRDRIDREFDRPLDVEELARGAHMSAGHLGRRFREAFGEPPYRYLMTRRVERAMMLLRRGDMSVTDVCFAVGFGSLGTFSLRFSELVGVAPSAYRAQVQGTPGIPSCVQMAIRRPRRNPSAEAAGTAGTAAPDQESRSGPAAPARTMGP